MEEKFSEFKVYKMGKKLGLFFNKSLMESTTLNPGDYVKLHIIYNEKQESFLSKFNYLITLRIPLINKLGLVKDDLIKLKIEKAVLSERAKNLFNKNKIDLLHLIPNENRLGFKILVNEFNKNNETWLKIWYCFERGSCKEIEIRRFVDIDKFGRFLGLMQSEGTKENIDVIEFCNKSIIEHLDFLDYLEEIGISRKELIGKFDYHPRIKGINKIIKEFEKTTNIKIRYIVPGPTSGGGYGFKVIFRSRLFREIIINSLKLVRNLIKIDSSDTHVISLRNAFFAKLLNGDGNLELVNKLGRKPLLRLKISDGKVEYLKDYQEIMNIYGLKSELCSKYWFVRSYIDYNFTKELLKMDAFKNNPNYDKLISYLNLIKTG